MHDFETNYVGISCQTVRLHNNNPHQGRVLCIFLYCFHLYHRNLSMIAMLNLLIINEQKLEKKKKTTKILKVYSKI